MYPIAELIMEDGRKMHIELYPDAAPNTVASFAALCREGFFDGLTFHRVVKDYIIQSGAPNGSCGGNKAPFFIRGEFSTNGFDNPLKHTRGTISMARRLENDSASTQIFLVHQDAPPPGREVCGLRPAVRRGELCCARRDCLGGDHASGKGEQAAGAPGDSKHSHQRQRLGYTGAGAPERRGINMLSCYERTLQELKKEGIDALVTYKPENTRYFTGFHSISRIDGHAVVDDSGITLFVNPVNEELARAETVPGVEIHVMAYMDTLGKYIAPRGYTKVAIEENYLTVQELDGLKAAMPECAFVYGSAVINEVRHTKEPERMQDFRKACAITDQIWQYLLTYIRPGVSEKDIEEVIAKKTREFGAEGEYFTPIVVSGERTSQPHGQPTERVLEKGDFVTVDMGVYYNGCQSDFTRTVVLGKATEKQRDVYETVRKAQAAALAGIRPGMMGKDADKIARDVIEAAGYGEYFIHGLGHGLDDGFRVSQVDKLNIRLRENMLFTVEPGIYIPGFGGVRIEDTVLLTENGCESLYTSSKELVEIPC